MGLLDLFSKEGREKSAVQRNIKRVQNKHLQSPDRFVALQKLRELGAASDEALQGLASRFGYVYDKLSEDEQEKEWVYEALAGFGERAVEPVKKYALAAETVSWPLRVLEKIAGKDALLAILDKILEREEPGYTRDPTKKIQVLTFLGEWKGAGADEVARRAVPYLGDFDETVRFNAIEVLAHHNDEASSRLPLLDALVRPEEESRRVKVRAAEVLAAAGWVVTERKEQVSKLLASLPEFGMQHDKLVKKKDK